MTTAGEKPDKQADVDALFDEAVRCETAGRLADAAATYRRVLALRPDFAAAYNNLGNVAKAQGQLDEAAVQYRQALALKPDLFQAHYNLGCVLQVQGQLEQALAHFEQLLALAPQLPVAHFSLAGALKAQGRLDEALARYEAAIALRPDYAEAHNNLGNILLSQGQLDRAAAVLERAVALRPQYAQAHNNLGLVLRNRGELDRATAHLEQAIALRPDYAEALNNLGAVHKDQGHFDEAVARFEAALALRPDYPEALNNLGNLLTAQGNFDQAVAQLERAIALRPQYVEAHNHLSIALWRQKQYGRATVHCRQALALRPDYPEARCNLANLLVIDGRLDEAAAECQRALEPSPDYPEAIYTMGNIRHAQGQIDQALALYQRATALRSDFAEAQLGLAVCHLVQGDFQRGWDDYEARFRLPGEELVCSSPRWTGQPLAGRSLLLIAEQGLGDNIQFLRFIPVLKGLGARIGLVCPPRLAPLLASLPGVDERFIANEREILPRYDFHLPLLSVAGVLGIDSSTIPGEVPYLTANPQLVEKWRHELAPYDGFKIGIVWQGSRSYNFDRWRSMPLAEFAPLARLPGVRLVSLQKGFGSEQIAMVDFPVVDLGEHWDEAAGPLMDSAAVIQNLDLVVAADTSITHLAGALGAPAFLALAISPDWRWQLDREDSPWYPTVRIFRQTVLGRWTDVFERIAQAVEALLAGSAAG